MNRMKLIEEVRRDEGCVLHAYEDRLGFLTIGIGRLIDSRKGGGITEEEAEYLLQNDVRKRVLDLDAILPWWKDLSDSRQRALLNMSFQLGVGGLLSFKKMLLAITREDWPEVYKQAMDSRWATQTPERAERVANMLLRGIDGI